VKAGAVRALASQRPAAAMLCVCGGLAAASMTGQCSHACLRELCSCDGEAEAAACAVALGRGVHARSGGARVQGQAG
jgi:hypothetical protein